MLVALGTFLLDGVALDGLAETAARLNRWEFLLVVAPLQVPGSTGSIVNPLAMFKGQISICSAGLSGPRFGGPERTALRLMKNYDSLLSSAAVAIVSCRCRGPQATRPASDGS